MYLFVCVNLTTFEALLAGMKQNLHRTAEYQTDTCWIEKNNDNVDIHKLVIYLHVFTIFTGTVH